MASAFDEIAAATAPKKKGKRSAFDEIESAIGETVQGLQETKAGLDVMAEEPGALGVALKGAGMAGRAAKRISKPIGGLMAPVLDVLIKPSEAAMGIAKAGISYAKGKGPYPGTPRRLVEAGKKGLAEHTTFGEAVTKQLAPAWSGEHPYSAAAVNFVGGNVTDPVNWVIPPIVKGISRGAKLGGEVALSAAERIPLVKRATSRVRSAGVAGKTMRELSDVRSTRAQPIAYQHAMTERKVTDAAKDIAKTQGKVVTPATEAPKLRFDLAAARGNLKRAKGREATAGQIVGRIEKQQGLGVRPTADVRQARADLETATNKLRAHDATWKDVKALGGPVPWKKKYDELNATVKLTQVRYDEVVKAAVDAKAAQAVPLSVARARGVQSRIIGKRATAQTALERLSQTMRSEGGMLPASRRGVNYTLPQPGEKVTPADVQVLTSALADSESISGMALTPRDARLEVIGAAQSLGLDMQKLQRAAKLTRMQGQQYTRSLVKVGVFSAEEGKAMETGGGYLRRIYERYTPGQQEVFLQKLRDAGMEEKARRLESSMANRPQVNAAGRVGTRNRAFTQRQNLPLETRQALGEIPFAGPRLRAQGTETAHTLSTAEMMQQIAADPHLASSTPVAGWIHVTPNKALENAEKMEQLGNVKAAAKYREAAKQGQWGALENMWVHPTVHDSLIPKSWRTIQLTEPEKPWHVRVGRYIEAMAAPAVESSGPSAIPGFGRLKRLNTLLSPGSQGANVLSNLAQMHQRGMVSGIRAAPQYIKGGVLYRRGGKFVMDAMKHIPGLANTSLTSELQDAMTALEQIAKGGRVEPSLLEKVRRTPAAVWQANEIMAKLGIADYHLARGKSWAQAAKLATQAVFNYADVPRGVEYVRSGKNVLSLLAPFPTFLWKAVPMTAQVAAEHPSRLNVYTRGRQAIESLSPKDETNAERNVLPDYERANFDTRLPMKDKYGRPMWWRTGRITPQGALAEPVQGGPGRQFFGIDPAINAIRGTDEYGRDIGGTLDRLAYVATRTVAPVAQLKALGESLRPQTAEKNYPKKALPPTPGEAVGRLLGVASVYPQDISRDRKRLEMDWEQGPKKSLDAWLKRKEEKKGKRLNQWAKDDADLKEYRKRQQDLQSQRQEMQQIRREALPYAAEQRRTIQGITRRAKASAFDEITAALSGERP